MLIAARRARSHAAGIGWSDFERDEVLQDAVAHQIQIVGEAAAQIQPSFRTMHPEIPWEKIIGTRHRIVHDYRRIRRDVLWQVVSESLPELISLLEPLVPPPADD